MQLVVSYSLDHDIKNYLDSIYKFKWPDHGLTNLERRLWDSLPLKFLTSLKNAKDEAQAREVIEKSLKKALNQNSEVYKKISKVLEIKWGIKNIEIGNKLKTLYEKEIPCFKIKIYLTSIMINTYDPFNHWIMVFYRMPVDRQLDTITHELNHFMFHYCFGYLRDEIGYQKWESLKEALTIFTDPPYKTGYPAQQKLRAWLKQQQGTIPEILSSNEWQNYL